MSTPYHAKYFAHELTRQGGSGVERLSRSLFDACVDLNPHQIEAALFAFRSPLTKGVLLADEVGLGKTIEAGLILCQSWAERRRKLLVICPASLRKQWAMELTEKFNLPNIILDAVAYRERLASGHPNPFDAPCIVITSMHFASAHAAELRAIAWDLVVIDEAHKLRNAYRESNRMGRNIRWALEDRRKVLLTATPLQNSLLELYGLSTILDDHIFGSERSFRDQYLNGKSSKLKELRERLAGFCCRTLRRQVLEYIRYTERRPITQPFTPSDDEHNLFEAITAFLRRPDTYALPKRQRHLTALVVRKLLSSSPKAVAATLETMRDRLIALRDRIQSTEDLADRLIGEEDLPDDLLEEFLDGDTDAAPADAPPLPSTPDAPLDPQRLNAEIEELTRYAQWARSIGIDTKSRALLKALEIGFQKMAEFGAAPKAVIFTESRRTQQYLKDFLEANGYAGRIVTFNGLNNDAESTRIYEEWLAANRDTGRSSGSRAVDVRTAIIERFRDHAQIMIATEAAAEGINLQFCSLVVNYDLPWNPQRIEQRIGRCHRYGQKHDVVVINFLNQRNDVDCRVYELLEEKFNLFNGIFGASDEVLGTIESGVDFERRIFQIWQDCRTPEEIEAAFQALRQELNEQIQTKMAETRQKLLEHFDEEVHERLRVNLKGTRDQLDRVGKMFWRLTQFMLRPYATFDDHEHSFQLLRSPLPHVEPGRYHLISKERENTAGPFLYRLSHPLGEYVLRDGQEVPTPPARVVFDISGYGKRIALVEALRGKTGWLRLDRLVIESFDREEYLLFAGFVENGEPLDQETCEKLFNCEAAPPVPVAPSEAVLQRLQLQMERRIKATIARSLEENNRHFQAARERLEKWAEDVVFAAEQQLKETKNAIKNLQRQCRLATTPEEQLALQKQIAELEAQKRRQRQRIFELEDEMEKKRDELIERLERQLTQRTSTEHLFTIQWSVV
jgi:superfamily II DNA or RNA helicase